MLPEVQVVREPCVSVQDIQAEIDTLAGLVYQIGIVLLGEAGRFHLFSYSQLLQALNHTPVVHRRTRRIDDPGFALDDRDADAGLRQSERSDEAGWTAAHDDHVLQRSLLRESCTSAYDRRGNAGAPACHSCSPAA